MSPWREFYEELVHPGILSMERFPYIYYEHVKTYVSGIYYMPDYHIYELKIAEVYEFVPTDEQLDELRTLSEKTDDRYMFATRTLILERKTASNTEATAQLSGNTYWIL